MITTNGERQAPLTIEGAELTHLVRYKFALQYLSAHHTTLDAPCGSGYGTAVLASKCSHVYGIDISRDSIEHAQEFFQLRNNSFHLGDMENLYNPFPVRNSLDLVVSFEGIEHLYNPVLFLKEAQRLLRPEGALLISTPRRPHGSPYHTREYSLDEFKSLLSGYFTVDTVFGQVYTDIFDLSCNRVNPDDFQKFNFIAHCSLK